MSYFNLIKNDLSANHLWLMVEMRVRSTGQFLEMYVRELIREAEKQDAWHELEPSLRTVGRLDDFLAGYDITWSG